MAAQTSRGALFRIHAASAAMERCFSAAGYIASARRCSLSDDMLKALLIAKFNGLCVTFYCAVTIDIGSKAIYEY